MKSYLFISIMIISNRFNSQISPYSVAKPVDFEYKAIDFTRFEKPISNAEIRYQNCLKAADGLETTFNSLNSDNQRRKKIENEILATKVNLINEIIRTGNYIEGEKKVALLNRLFKEDPEKRMIEYNKKAFETYKNKME